jgi:hypothetical protein
MSKFQMFDSVTLNQDIQLYAGGIAPQGTDGAIVEIFKDGEAYLVELFGGWSKLTTEGNMIEASQDDPEAFRDTLVQAGRSNKTLTTELPFKRFG